MRNNEYLWDYGITSGIYSSFPGIRNAFICILFAVVFPKQSKFMQDSNSNHTKNSILTCSIGMLNTHESFSNSQI